MTKTAMQRMIEMIDYIEIATLKKEDSPSLLMEFAKMMLATEEKQIKDAYYAGGADSCSNDRVGSEMADAYINKKFLKINLN